MIPVRVQDEVLDYLKRLPPEPRHSLRLGIRGLQEEKGNIRALTNELEGYFRLRVSKYRILFKYRLENNRRSIDCVYAGERAWVYEVFHHKVTGEE
jgi:mRNA interferase RelE/StbE